MARHKMAPGTWGDIGYRTLDDGKVEGRVWYRTIAGARKDTTARGKTKSAVERELKLRLPGLVSRAAPAAADDKPKTFAQTAAKWLEFEEAKVQTRQKAPTTHAEHVRILRAHLLPAFGNREVADIDSGDVFDYYLAMHQQHAPLARNVKSVLSSILAHARVLRYATGENPAVVVKSLRREKKAIFAPDLDELASFRSAIIAYNEDPDRPGPMPNELLLDVVDLILATGLRVGEVLALRYGKDIILDAPKPYIIVNGAIKEKGGPKRWEPFPKTEHGHREIVLPSYAVNIILRRQLDNTSGSEFLFHTNANKKPGLQRPNGQQDVHRAVRRVRAHAGLADDYIPHALRKNVATEIAGKMGLDAAAGNLGHGLSRITEQFYFKRDLRAPDASDLLQAQYELLLGDGAD